MSSIEGHFGGSCLNVGEQMPVRVPALAFSGVDPEGGLLDRRVTLCPGVRGPATVFLHSGRHAGRHAARPPHPRQHTSRSAFVSLRFFNNSHPSRCASAPSPCAFDICWPWSYSGGRGEGTAVARRGSRPGTEPRAGGLPVPGEEGEGLDARMLPQNHKIQNSKLLRRL